MFRYLSNPLNATIFELSFDCWLRLGRTDASIILLSTCTAIHFGIRVKTFGDSLCDNRLLISLQFTYHLLLQGNQRIYLATFLVEKGSNGLLLFR